MKKLLMILTMIFLSVGLMGQKMSNYEKYKLEQEKGVTAVDMLKEAKIEYDDLYFQPSKDVKVKKQRTPYRSETDKLVDTLKKYNPNVTVNIYELDPFYYSGRIGRFHHYGFNYWMYSSPWYYANNYWMYDSYDWYWEYRFMRNSYSWAFYPYYNNFYFGYTTFGNYWRPWPNYGYNGWYNGWYNNNHYYGMHNQNQWRGGMGGGIAQTTPQYGRRERPSTMTNSTPPRQQQMQPNRNRTTTSPQNMKAYSDSRRSYTPTYESPRMSTRPAYNNSKPSSGMIEQRRATMNNNGMQQGSMNRGNMSNGTTNNVRTAPVQNRAYSAPSRSYVETQSRREYSPAQSNYNSSPNRSYSEPSRSYSGGGESRSSGSSSSSSGSSSSSSGSSSSSSGSSGTSSGRR